MPAALKWILIALAVLLLALYGLFTWMAGGPKDAFYMVRYAFPHMRPGKLKVGDLAPDAPLVALDGSTRFHIRERTTGRPLVLVFGSFT
jgi:hypothetical protein